LDPGNSTWTTTLANLNTLGSLISAFATVADDDWRSRFLQAATSTAGATPKNTLEAMAGIARTPWANPRGLYVLFDEAYPQPKDGARRKAPFAPYLDYPPPDFILSLGSVAAGRTPTATWFRFRGQHVVWPELDGGLAVRSPQEHRRRLDQVQP